MKMGEKMKCAEDMTISELQKIIDKKRKEKNKLTLCPYETGILKHNIYAVFIDDEIGCLTEEIGHEMIAESVALCLRKQAKEKKKKLVNKYLNKFKKILNTYVFLMTEVKMGHTFECWKIGDKYRWYPQNASDYHLIETYTDGFSNHWAKRNLKNIKNYKDNK